MAPVVGLIISYVAGSIPSAYIAGKLRASTPQARSGNLEDERRARPGAKTGASYHCRSSEGFSPGLLLRLHRDTKTELWRSIRLAR